MQKWPFEILANQFLKDEKGQDDRAFSQWACYQTSGKKEITKKASQGFKKTNKYCLKLFFNFHKNDYNSAENIEFLAKSNFNSSVNFGSLMTNDDALELWRKGEFVFGNLAGDRNNCENKSSVQGKQTVCSQIPNKQCTVQIKICLW